MYKKRTYFYVFLITAIWDYLWQLLASRKLYICVNEMMLCPSDWKWIKTGEKYFKEHSSLGAMAIAGVCGMYALFTMDIVNSVFRLKYNNYLSQILVCLFASWVVGIPMRYSSDPLHKYLFSSLRKHYYKPLGFTWSSFTDAQSGLIVLFTFQFIIFITACGKS